MNTTTATNWPTRDELQATPVTAWSWSDTHTIDYSADGILTIQVDAGLLSDLAEVPEFVEQTKEIRGCVKLNQAGIDALRRVLAAIDKPKQSAPSLYIASHCEQ
jgi:hypothetical protein